MAVEVNNNKWPPGVYSIESKLDLVTVVNEKRSLETSLPLSLETSLPLSMRKGHLKPECVSATHL